MRIAVLGSHAVSLCTFRGPMMQAMVAAGHEVIGLAPSAGASVPERLAKLGVAYRDIPLGRTNLNPLQDFRTILSLTDTFREIKPDLLLSYTVKPVIYGSIAAARAGVPHRHAMITGLGSTLIGEGLKMQCVAGIVKSLYRFALRRNENVFFQNPDDRAFFERNGLIGPGCRVTMINGSGVDLDHYRPSPQPSGRPLTFLMTARITRDKGVIEFVEAARIIRRRHPEVVFQLLGPMDSNPTALTKEQVMAWQSEGVIEYLGATDEVRPMLAAAHVFVLPSYGEGTPRCVLESMSAGRAVITTRVAGCKETVHEGVTGFLVPARDPSALAEAMERFIRQPALAAIMGSAGRALAEEKYDVRKVNAVILAAMNA